MKVRACAPFTVDDQLNLQFADKFIGVVIIIECGAAESDQLMAKFSEPKKPAPAFAAGQRVEVIDSLVRKLGTVTGAVLREDGWRYYVASPAENGQEVLWFLEKELQEFRWRRGDRVKSLPNGFMGKVDAVELETVNGVPDFILKVTRYGDSPGTHLFWRAADCELVP